MQHAGDRYAFQRGEPPTASAVSRQYTAQAVRREISNADRIPGLKNSQYLGQSAVTKSEERFPVTPGQLVRRQVCSLPVEKTQRAVVDNDVRSEKPGGAAEAGTEESPETPSTHFMPRTGEPRYRTPGMRLRRPADRPGYPQPIPDRIHLPERDPGLEHPPRPWIHSQKNRFVDTLPTPGEVLFPGSAGIDQGIVYVRNGRAEREHRDFAGHLSVEKYQAVSMIHDQNLLKSCAG
jgi:hypothetical protein